MTDVAKLPKWAQEHIGKIERERDVAVRALNAFCDEQTKSPYYVDDHICTGEEQGPVVKTRYIQTHKMTVSYCGVELNILTRTFSNEKRIELQWNATDIRTREVAFIPTSYQAGYLVAKEHMR